MDKNQLKLLLDELEKKNSWGKNEVRSLILEIAAGIKQ